MDDIWSTYEHNSEMKPHADTCFPAAQLVSTLMPLVGLKYTPEVDLCYLNQPAGSWRRIKSHYLMMMMMTGGLRQLLPALVEMIGHGDRGFACFIVSIRFLHLARTSHLTHVLKDYYGNNTLQSHTVIRLACVASHISIVPMLALKMPFRGARAFTQQLPKARGPSSNVQNVQKKKGHTTQPKNL